MAKLIVVLGATGRQGGSVAQTLLNYPEKYSVRALSRDPSQPRALELAKQGVEVVKGDLRDEKSLSEALKGAYGVFAVTDYHAQNVTAAGQSDEAELGIAVAEAAKSAGVKHYIFSTLPSASSISKGKYTRLEHFETKALAMQHIKQKLPELPTTFVYCSAYFDAFAGPPFLIETDEKVTVTMPVAAGATLPMVWVTKDLGPVVERIFDNAPETIGQTYSLAKKVKMSHVVEIMDQVTGKPTDYVPIPPDDFLAQFGGGVQAYDILGNLQFFAEYEGFGGDEIEPTEGKLLGYELSQMKDFLKATFDKDAMESTKETSSVPKGQWRQ